MQSPKQGVFTRLIESKLFYSTSLFRCTYHSLFIPFPNNLSYHIFLSSEHLDKCSNLGINKMTSVFPLHEKRSALNNRWIHWLLLCDPERTVPTLSNNWGILNSCLSHQWFSYEVIPEIFACIIPLKLPMVCVTGRLFSFLCVVLSHICGSII